MLWGPSDISWLPTSVSLNYLGIRDTVVFCPLHDSIGGKVKREELSVDSRLTVKNTNIPWKKEESVLEHWSFSHDFYVNSSLYVSNICDPPLWIFLLCCCIRRLINESGGVVEVLLSIRNFRQQLAIPICIWRGSQFFLLLYLIHIFIYWAVK